MLCFKDRLDVYLIIHNMLFNALTTQGQNLRGVLAGTRIPLLNDEPHPVNATRAPFCCISYTQNYNRKTK